MFRLAAASLAIALSASVASADTLNLFDEAGAAVAVDTSSINGCKMVFDSNGDAFEFCRLEKIELRPQASTRVRPGANAAPQRDNVVYAKHAPDPTSR